MNDAVMDLLMDRMDSRRGVRGSGRSDRRNMDSRDRRDRRDMEDSRDYEDGYEDGYADARRGVKGTGRYGRRDRIDNEDGMNDMNRLDGHRSPLRLSKEDMREWKKMLENADGTHGTHYDMSQIMSVVDKLDIKFDEFSEAEFCMTVNMLYSDYCHTVKKYIPQEKALEFYACMAKDFLDDDDGPEPWTKLMLYYHCIVNG